MFDWLGCWFWVARLPAATPGPRNLEKVHQQPGITRPCCDFWRILRLKTHTHTYIIYIKRDIFGWCFFYIFVGPALAMGWWSNMSYVFGIGWNQHRRIIVGYPLQGVGAAEVTYTCKMDPLYGDIVSGRTGHRATRLQFPVQFRTPQHLRKLNPNTDSHIFWECQWVHISIGLCAIPTCVGESPLILVNLSVPAAILSIAQRVVSLTK